MVDRFWKNVFNCDDVNCTTVEAVADEFEDRETLDFDPSSLYEELSYIQRLEREVDRELGL